MCAETPFQAYARIRQRQDAEGAKAIQWDGALSCISCITPSTHNCRKVLQSNDLRQKSPLGILQNMHTHMHREGRDPSNSSSIKPGGCEYRFAGQESLGCAGLVQGDP